MKNKLFFAGVFLLSMNTFGQKVEEPVKVRTEKNGVEIHSTHGNETRAEGQLFSTENPQVAPKTINDLTVAEIDEMLFGINAKIEQLAGSNETELLKLLEEKRTELQARRATLQK